ncbi:DNA topoisomerase 3 [Acidithiobacillus thiooxidans]|uniref:DNA topoisomerase n=1 Tax=Acidithiobacillus thiooxidans ATCC 19377 TaxID=637390 RepID=A0A5P9XSS2_ACITH|nr:DNA topoisomerase 3 [Acidithiobacillus thiooxidans]QFX96730.1 DNA topoisomerase III [Acidithiobacillus thiooxidans ATCC 19377]
MSTVIIAEKPSMARAIREGLGAKASQYEITNAFGHILEQAEPDDYLPDDLPRSPKTKKKIWRMEDLPILPGEWIKHPKPDAKDQLKKIGQLLKNADVVINAGDPDREGQLLIDEILEHFRYRGRVQRVWLKALDQENVRKAFASLEDNGKYQPLKDAAEARSRADWLVGMNLTRAVTLRSGAFFSVGRVQTPTLALIVDRDNAIEHFRPQDYFEVLAKCRHVNGAFLAKWQPKHTDGPGFDAEGRIINRNLAERIAAKARGQGKVTRYESKEQKQSAPLPFNLSALQKTASARFGMSAQQVLDTAQSLYEKKLTSYPRSDCRYLPEEQLADASRILKQLPMPDAARKLLDPRRKHAAWNNAKVTAHNAIIPTGETPNGLSPAEERLYQLVMQPYVALFLPDYRYLAISATVELGGETWKATGRKDIDPGWKVLYGNGADDEEESEDRVPLPQMQTGDPLQGQEGEVQAKQTKPPARFTDGTLIEAMSNIHKFVDDPEAKKKLKETSGLGTEATRANIIETLLKRDVLEKKGKQLVSTSKGRSLIAWLRKDAVTRNMADPVTTAQWEDYLTRIAEGALEPARFGKAITTQVETIIGRLKEGSGVSGFDQGKKEKSTPCPVPGCGGTVRRMESKKKKGVFFWACSNRDAHPLLADEKGKPGAPFGSEKGTGSSGGAGTPCPVPGCGGTVRRIESKKKKGTFFWACSNRDGHPLLADENGKPGQPFGARK